MISTTHPFAPEEIMAYVDGELPAAEAQAISSHISECAECTELAAQFRSLSLSLASWEVEAAPATLDDSIRNAAAQANPSSRHAESARRSFSPSPKPSPWTWKHWTWKQWAWSSAGALATLAIVFSISSNSKRYERMSAYMDSTSTAQDRKERIAPPPPPPVEPGRTVGGVIQTDSFYDAPAPTPLASASKRMGSGGGGDQANLPAASAPMIARTASLIVVVKDFNVSRSVLDAILARHQGYSAQLDIETPQNASRNFKASLRVPATELTATIAELRSLGVVVNETQAGEEVSQQHTDLVARLKNARETEERFRAILQQRTGKIEDVLQVEQEIERVRGEIETMEAAQKALEHRIDFATVDLQLTEEYQAHLDASSTSVSTRMRNAFVNGYRNASDTLLGIVLFFAEAGPTMLIFVVLFGVPGFILFKRYRKARTRLE